MAGGAADTPFGYAGQYTDPETGFLYLQARYYDPATGQFLTRDPLVDLTGQPYTYAGDNPLSLSDPWGMAGGCASNGLTQAVCGVGSGVKQAIQGTGVNHRAGMYQRSSAIGLQGSAAKGDQARP